MHLRCFIAHFICTIISQHWPWDSGGVSTDGRLIPHMPKALYFDYFMYFVKVPKCPQNRKMCLHKTKTISFLVDCLLASTQMQVPMLIQCQKSQNANTLEMIWISELSKQLFWIYERCALSARCLQKIHYKIIQSHYSTSTNRICNKTTAMMGSSRRERLLYVL